MIFAATAKERRLTMADFINLDAAYDSDTLTDWYISSVGSEPPVWTDEHIEELLNDFYVIPKDTPTADVAPVVRCKDCEYASYWYGNDNLKNTTYLCFFAEDEGVKTFADDFCSRGKRRE